MLKVFWTDVYPVSYTHLDVYKRQDELYSVTATLVSATFPVLVTVKV